METMIPKDDAEWRASSDYNALVTAEICKSDPERLNAAKAWGKKYEAAKKAEETAAVAVAKM